MKKTITGQDTIIRFTCPYCNNKFDGRVLIQGRTINKDVVLCDVDETPGCDRYFVVFIELKPTIVEVYKMEQVNV